MAGAVPDANTIITMINCPENDKLTHLALLAIIRLPRILSHSRFPGTYQKMPSMRQKTYFKSCVRDIEFPGKELDSKNKAGAIVGYVPWPGHLWCDGQQSYFTTNLGLCESTL